MHLACSLAQDKHQHVICIVLGWLLTHCLTTCPQAAKNKSKYTGVSSSAARYGGFEGGSSSSSSRYGGFEGGSSSSKYGGFEGGSSNAYGGGSSSSYGHDSGSGAAAAAAGSSGEAADPVEATRQRIARLKAEGAIAAGAAGGSAAEGGSSGGAPLEGGLDSPGGAERKPKKLSDIKINPAISAMFAKTVSQMHRTQPPTPSCGRIDLDAKGGLAPPPASSASAAAANSSSGIDLLGDLDGPAPAAAGAADEWDGFASAPAAGAAGIGAKAPAAAAGDEWASFESAPAASSQRQHQVSKLRIWWFGCVGKLMNTAAYTCSVSVFDCCCNVLLAEVQLDLLRYAAVLCVAVSAVT
jgi:epsin